MLIPGWHPLIVHFPFALSLTAAAAFFAARVARDESLAATLATVGTWNLCAGALAALFAVGSGIAALIGLHAGAAAHLAISIHAKLAMLTSLMLVLLAVWRGAGSAQSARPGGLFLALLLAASLLLAATGYRGDVNVYHYGVGVAARSAALGCSGLRNRSTDQPPPRSPINATASTRRLCCTASAAC